MGFLVMVAGAAALGTSPRSLFSRPAKRLSARGIATKGALILAAHMAHKRKTQKPAEISLGGLVVSFVFRRVALRKQGKS